MTLIIISCFLLGLSLLSKTNKSWVRRTLAGNNYIGKLNETINGAKLIIGFGLHNKEFNSNVSLLRKYISSDLKSQIVNLIATYLFKPLGIIILIFVFSLVLKYKYHTLQFLEFLWCTSTYRKYIKYSSSHK